LGGISKTITSAKGDLPAMCNTGIELAVIYLSAIIHIVWQVRQCYSHGCGEKTDCDWMRMKITKIHPADVVPMPFSVIHNRKPVQ
jgi:hypothetical protein